MNKDALRKLGFEKIVEACRHTSIIDAPLAGIPEFPMFFERNALLEELRLVGIFKHLWQLHQHNLGNIRLINNALKLLAKQGHVPDIEGLEDIASMLACYSEAKSWLLEDIDSLEKSDAQILRSFLSNWNSAIGLIKILRPYFNPKFREDEISSLNKIRLRIQGLHSSIQNRARAFLRKNKDMWSSKEPSQRDGRVVLVLKSNHTSKVEGIVHGYSGTGQSVYIEPGELLEENNNLREAQNAYKAEIHRILRHCSEQLAPHYAELEAIQHHISRFNSLQARARFGKDIEANPACFADESICLIDARHPELGRNAVPISISMKPPTRIVVISGPNTGGKTVGMKTLGLLCIMNQSGMEIPAAMGSKLPLFSEIFIDVGDEQSIAEGLSTFSAHLQNLSRGLGFANKKALFLLDELGTGTDPNEGAAIAMSIMNYLAERCSFAVITTHLDSIKALAFQNPNMENASVSFDAQNPNYTIQMGVPGESLALEIAAKVGMPEKLLAHARAIVKEKGLVLHTLVDELRKLKEDLLEEKDRNAMLSKEIKADREHLIKKEDSLRKRELLLKKEILLEQDVYLSQSRKKIEALLADLNRRSSRLNKIEPLESAEESSLAEVNIELRRTIQELNESQVSALEELRVAETSFKKDLIAKLQPGTSVHCKGMSQPLILIEQGRKKDSWIAKSGSMKITVRTSEIESVDMRALPASSQNGTTGKAANFEKRAIFDSSPEPFKTMLDIRGMRVDAAMKELDKFIDRACLLGLGTVSLIHGKGTGALQESSHIFLKEHPQIKSVNFALPEDGGSGKTYITLRE